MRRLLLLGTAFALVATACGAGASPAPRLSNTAAHTPPSLRAIAKARKREAGRQAQRLLRRVVLPAGARRIGKPGVLGKPDTGISLTTELAWRFAYWSVPRSIASVAAFVKFHPVAGFHYYGGAGIYQSLYFDNGFRGTRQRLVTIELASPTGRTVVRVKTEIPWIYPRSPHE